MKKSGERSRVLFLIQHSSFCIQHFPHHAASDVTEPPGRFTHTGRHAGPLSLRPLNQNAVNQTIAPGAVSMGKFTSNVVRPVFPSNFQSLSSAGGVAPTWLNKAAPMHPTGRPRRPAVEASISFTTAVRPLTDLIAT